MSPLSRIFNFLRLRVVTLSILLQRDDDSGSLGRELSEDEYDALNDETFTHAVRDDWEGKRAGTFEIQRV